MTDKITIEPIGIIHTPFRKHSGSPIQPAMADGGEGAVEVYERYSAGLSDLDGFDRIWLVFHLDRAAPPPNDMMLVPYRDTVKRGLFSTRAPCRPNPVGISPVRLLAVEDNILRVGEIDILDGTPLLDIKPYSPRFDCFPDARAGWLDDIRRDARIADDRFEK